MFTMDLTDPPRAYNAGPRRDPLAFQRSAEAAAAVGRPIPETPSIRSVVSSPYDANLFGSGCQVPDQWPRSMETGMLARTMPSSGFAMPASKESFTMGRTAGAAHENLGIFAQQPLTGSIHLANLSKGLTEEERRLLLLTGERRRKGAHLRQQPTDTLGLRGSEFQTRFAREDPHATTGARVSPQEAAARLADAWLADLWAPTRPGKPADLARYGASPF
jgi:hypothetical protein